MRFLFCCALFLKLAFEDQVFHIEVLIEENDVGFLARGDAAVGIVDADGLCGIHRGMPIFLTAVRMQSMRLVALPAMVPSARVARFPTTFTGCPPRE